MSRLVRLGRRLRLLALSAPLALGSSEVAAQVGTISPARIVSLSAIKPGQLTVSVTSGMVQSIPAVVDNAVNSFSGPATIVTQWNVNPGQTNTVNLVAYFSLPPQALTGPVAIPSGRLLGRMTTGIPVAFTPITQNGIGVVGTAGGSLRLFAQNITGVNKNSSRTDNLDLQLNLVGFPTLPTGFYTGTLNLRAITQ